MWSLYEQERLLEPLRFSNGKTQETVVKEALDAIRKGERIIFIHGQCGTGKSAVALNIAKNLGKSCVIVPIKNLQSQYKRDYEKEKYLIKENDDRLKISIITGRQNHKCQFLEDNKNSIPKIKREINSKLQDIFEGTKQDIDNLVEDDKSADNKDLPCKIEIKERNYHKLKEYIKQNEEVSADSFVEIKNITRIPVASLCKYWSPALDSLIEPKLPSFKKAHVREFEGLDGKRFKVYKRCPGCTFYSQFDSYIDSDVIVFNSAKYKLEFAMNRKPKTEAEIIDEGDEFLDSFSNREEINLEFLQNSIVNFFPESDGSELAIFQIKKFLKNIKKDSLIKRALNKREIIPVKQTLIYRIFKIFLENKDFSKEIDEESYLYHILKIAKIFHDSLDGTFIRPLVDEDKNLVMEIVSISLEKRFKELSQKNKILIFMSGTIHSKEVLKDIFGIENFLVIEAETKHQGQITLKKTGLEMNCRYANLKRDDFARKHYLSSLDKCVEISKKPTLIHVNSYSDLPKKEEKEKYQLNNLISSEELMKIQKNDSNGKLIEEFKEGKKKILFSTRCSRGVDFPGGECNSIIFTKYPNPNIDDIFWRILKKIRPEKFWEFYKDKARREFLQKIYRGLRHKNDHIYLLSPDTRVFEAAKEI